MKMEKYFSNKFKYPNLIIFFLFGFLTYFLFKAGIYQKLVLRLEDFGYLGAFLAGMFFISTFTAIPAATVLFLFAERFDNLPFLALVAGAGAVLGDYFVFRFVKDGLADELKGILKHIGGGGLLRVHWIAHTKYFGWLGPVLGALIIASPLPDELGVGLLGIYKMENKKFILLSFILNTIGIFALLSVLKNIN